MAVAHWHPGSTDAQVLQMRQGNIACSAGDDPVFYTIRCPLSITSNSREKLIIDEALLTLRCAGLTKKRGSCAENAGYRSTSNPRRTLN
jgi:hypothetical protein